MSQSGAEYRLRMDDLARWTRLSVRTARRSRTRTLDNLSLESAQELARVQTESGYAGWMLY